MNVELTKIDYEHYCQLAKKINVSFEELILQSLEHQIENQKQWVIPHVEEDGSISLENGTPIELPINLRGEGG